MAVEAHPGLVALHKAVQTGWVPPEHVNEEDYKAARRGDPADPRVAFVGFGCSFSGKWWGGYARDRTGGNYAQQSSKALRRDARANVEHVANDALVWPCDGAEVIYCDPPYVGTTGYNAVAVAKDGAWWHRLAVLAHEGRACYLSEYAEAPPVGIDARLVWSAATHGGQLTKGTKTERLWRVLGFVGAANGPATPSEDPTRADPAPPTAEPATAPLEPAANEADPWDALPPMMPIAA